MMKNNKLLFFLIVISSVMQNMFFSTNDQIYSFVFAVGLPEDYICAEMLVYVLMLTVPILFINFFFSENIYGLKNGYGRLYVVRHYSKSRLILKEELNVFTISIILSIIQALVYILHNGKMMSLPNMQIVLSVASYALGLTALIFLQMLTEFFMDPAKAVLTTHIFLIISVYLSKYADNKAIKILLFPINMFGLINGSDHGSMVYWESIIILLIWIILISLLNTIKFKKEDIF